MFLTRPLACSGVRLCQLSRLLCVHDAVVYDMNGREAEEAELILDVLPDIEQYIFCSSAGV